jgi:hypothetical protein
VRTVLRVLSAGLVGLIAEVPAEAQVLQRPERPLRGLFAAGPPPDPDRPWRSLVFTASTLGGYDDNLTPDGGAGSIDLIAVQESGYTGFADAGLIYRRGRNDRRLELGGHGYVNAFRNVGLAPSYGGKLQTGTTLPMGPRHSIDFRADARSEPFFTVGAFAPLRRDVQRGILPESNPLNGFAVRRSFGASASAALLSNWTRRDEVKLSYEYDWRDFEDDFGDGESQRAALAYSRSISRRSRFAASYRYSQDSFLDEAGFRRLTATQDVSLGWGHERRLSRTRRMSFGFGAGATYLSAAPSEVAGADHVLPSGYGDFQVDLARTWSLAGNYRRSVTVLDGLSAETFIADAALVRFGGQVHPRAELAVAAGYSTGRTPVGLTSEFETYTATTQLQYRLSSWSAAVVSHTFYSYRLDGVDGLLGGLPDRLDRNALRVGMSVLLPLYGRLLEAPAEPGGRN